MVRPTILTLRPGFLLSLLGGLVATLLLSALIFLAPAFGFPFVDIPRLVGGIFTDDPTVAFWLGFWIFFLVGMLVFAPALALVWPALPGSALGFGGVLVKGVLWGLALWLLSGLLLPLMGALNRLGDQGVANPGFFALSAGALAPVGLLLGHLLYGVAVALVAAMGQGIAPLDTLGWPGYAKAESPLAAPRRNR